MLHAGSSLDLICANMRDHTALRGIRRIVRSFKWANERTKSEAVCALECPFAGCTFFVDPEH